MLNDAYKGIIDYIDMLFVYLIGTNSSLTSFFENLGIFFDELEKIVSMIFFFIPKTHLVLILGAVMFYIIVRIVMSIVNVLWP